MSISKAAARDVAKKAYVAPALTAYGSVRNLTGGSDGAIGDGGATKRLKP